MVRMHVLRAGDGAAIGASEGASQLERRLVG
jgi:hypothetical protein